METKIKRKIAYFFFILPITLVAFFVFNNDISAKDKEILINEIYAEENDDWIELYNSTDNDIDLANNYRIYKSVSSSPSLLMRFGNISDGSYPGGTIIKSHEYYLVVRDNASSKLLEIADAICNKTSFTWDGSGYTIYFGDNAISTIDDPDIIDEVRFVDAKNDTAPEIQKGKSIGRLNEDDTGNNSQDFTLQNPTPGSENKKLDEESGSDSEETETEINELNLQVEIKQDKEIFPKIYSNFDAVIFDKDGNKLQLNREGKKYEYNCNIDKEHKCSIPILKFTWDFGDKHKSYLFSTKHKYEKEGVFNAILIIKGENKETIKNFIVSVGKIPHPEVKIIAVNANPVGSDTENETITLQNKSKKKVNLIGWSIATGWKKLMNHPININFEIKAGKKKEITREFSKFTLNNKKSEIELRYPDGEVADSIKYNKKKDSIVEGEIYTKEKKKWAWVVNKQQAVDNNQPASIATPARNDVATSGEQSVAGGETNNEQENNPEEDIVAQPKIERENKLAFNQRNIFKINLSNNAPRVLGAETVREVNGTYFFTPKYPQQEHYAIVFIKNIFILLNFKINILINYFTN